MYNIWSFLLQTIAVSIVAGVILILKKIFEDKLSPKWQYGIWALLAIRILVPVNLGSYIIPQFALWIEMLKAGIEAQISSVFTSVYEPITLQHILPTIVNAPQSITDWLFVIYMIGVVIFLLKYFIAYIRLRMLLKHGSKINAEMEEKMLSVCDTYNLKGCKMIAVNGLSSAFICGVFRPILVVPAQCNVNEKVLLHELLHLKHHDTIQNVGWCILRSLHWCNPFIHYVINHIENDMESLCDQRVLELLEGEERREYGAILLNMANQKYARIPGTTSISNGGNNISKRIAAIVRFKKYPQGMTLVSICIILTLFWPTIIGSSATYDKLDYTYYSKSYDTSMTIARINRCGTVAGAIDMYAKGLYLMNGGYVATASSFSEHERITKELEEYGCYQPGKYVGNIHYLNDYRIYNLDQRNEREYIATICYNASMYIDENTPELLEQVGEEMAEYPCDAYIFVPIAIKYEDAWVVEEIDERYIVAVEDSQEWNTNIICPKKYYGKNDIGEIYMEIETRYTVNNTVQDQNLAWFTDITSFDQSPKPNAVFNHYYLEKHITYTHLIDEKPRSYVELMVKEKDTEDYFANDETFYSSNDHSEDGWRIYEGTIDWDGSIEDYSGGGFGTNDSEGVENIDMASKYSVKWNIAGVEQEEIILEEVKE